MMFEEGFTWNAVERIWEIDKDPDATIICRLHWYQWLRGDDQYWKPRAYIDIGDTYTPQHEAQNGRRYRCTVGGRTGATAPTWPTSSTVTDGGVTWSHIGLEDRLDTIDFTASTGLTVDSDAKDATETVAEVTLSGGTAGQSYLVTCAITTDGGLDENQRFRVKVREQ
jgi:hypothetical protein